LYNMSICIVISSWWKLEPLLILKTQSGSSIQPLLIIVHIKSGSCREPLLISIISSGSQ
jgi:hypothetical protein